MLQWRSLLSHTVVVSQPSLVISAESKQESSPHKALTRARSFRLFLQEAGEIHSNGLTQSQEKEGTSSWWESESWTWRLSLGERAAQTGTRPLLEPRSRPLSFLLWVWASPYWLSLFSSRYCTVAFKKVDLFYSIEKQSFYGIYLCVLYWEVSKKKNIERADPGRKGLFSSYSGGSSVRIFFIA